MENNNSQLNKNGKPQNQNQAQKPNKPARKRLDTIRGRMPIYIGLLALVLAGMWLVSRCSHPQSALIADQYSRPGGDTLSVAIEMSPLTYAYSGDTVVGFDYELLKNICKVHKLPVKFQPFAPLDYAFNGLDNGTFDMVVANIPATAELREKYAVTEPIFTDKAVLVQRLTPDSTITVTNGRGLAGDSVWIAYDSPISTRLYNLSSELGDTIYVKSDPNYNAELLCLMVEQGKIKYAVVNQTVAKQMAEDYPGLDISVPISFSQFQTWVMPKNKKELLTKFNIWITEYKKTSAYKQLVNKYL